MTEGERLGRTFVVAKNPDPNSRLGYLIRIPMPTGSVLLKAREPWPRTSRVFCYPLDEWPSDAEILEEAPIRSCVRRGAAIDLLLERSRENRSQIVFTNLKGGQSAIFWQSRKTAAASKPGARIPRGRASGQAALEILVDSRERYPYRFGRQQAVTRRVTLPAGDYGVEVNGVLIAAVERKTLDNLAHSLIDGSLPFVLSELAALDHAAVAVEDRYSRVFKLEFVRTGWVPELLAVTQARYQAVPIVFCDSRKLAEEWTYRFLGAALAQARSKLEEGGML